MEQHTMLNRLEGNEVLQPSSLDKYTWPGRDPNEVDQRSRLWTPADDLRVAAAATRTTLTPERAAAETAGLPMAERLQWILSHKEFNFNGVNAVRNEPKWRPRLEDLVRAGDPAPLPYPLFCSIANPAKQMTRPGPNAGERAAIHWFRYLDTVVRAVYAPGIHVHLLSDATLYNNALQNTAAAAYAYVAKAQALVRELGAEAPVTVHDYAALLVPVQPEFDRLYNHYYARLESDPTLIDEAERARLMRSMRANVNTERLGLTYADCRALFGPAPDAAHPLAAEVEQMARTALRDQLAVKLACVTLDLPQRLWPNHVRASCHKGRKSGVAVVGLRVYPEYYRRSSLLPYHGKPWIRPDGRLVVQPEFELRGRTDLVRLVDENGAAVCYISEDASA